MKDEIFAYLKDSFGLEGADAEELYRSYLDTLNEKIAAFPAAFGSKNFDALRMAAHSVKGCALNCGHSDMAVLAKEMEEAAKIKDIALCRNRADELERLTRTL